MSKQRILFYDLETLPNVIYSWGVWEQNALDVVKNWELLCFAYKWADEKEVKCLTRRGQKTDKELTLKLWRLINEADVVVAHNGDEFDNKKANAKFIEHGLTPPKPYQSIDTKKLAKNRFRFNSNRLNDLGKLLGLGTKVQTGGFDLWLGCMNGDAKAWQTMVKYNKQDVVLLEKVYMKLRPWASKHPNLSYRNLASCPKCKSEKLQKRGFVRTVANTFQQYQCQDCGGWCRARVGEKGAQKQVIVNG